MGTAICPIQHMYVVNNSIKFDKFVPSLFHPNVTLQLECKRTMRTDKIKLKNNIEDLLDSLSKSKFRGSFHLNKKMKDYVKEKGFDKIKLDARDLITKRIAPENPNNDGKQTPMRQVHPVFIAQHATGCCCRGCLERIHGIKKGHELSSEEIEYVVNTLMLWIQREMSKD